VRFLIKFVGVLAVAALGLAVSAAALAPQASRIFAANHGKAAPINLNALAQRSLIFDRNGSLLASLHAEQNRAPVTLAEVPQLVRDAILSVEDDQFYAHKGVDLKGTLRALFANVQSGGVEQGGSTITMQVVKNTLLTPDRDLSTKVREMVLANRLEQQMTKDQILERYLNTVYFGNGAYGVQAGAETYFGKSVGQLDWPEAALLASLIRNPRDYDPFKNPPLALERRRLALQRLVETGHLTQQAADLYAFTPLPTAPFQVLPPPNDYFVEEVKQLLLDDPILGATPTDRYNAVFSGGLKVYTTFDPTMQYEALTARNNDLPGPGDGTYEVPTRDPAQLADCHAPEGAAACPGGAALVSLDSDSGAIRAMVGGPGFENYKYNLATAANRQPGSSFKTFVLVTLLENGYVPSDTVNGSAPCSIPNPGGLPDPYIANNAEGSAGVAAITSQTAGSVNCAFLRLGQIVGVDKVVDQARKMGITSPLSAVPSLPLGVYGVSPLEMAGAYASIANDGIYNKPYYIDRIEDRDGNVIFQHKADGHRAMSQQTARLAADTLTHVVTGGTGTRAKLAGRQVAGKTGTAQDNTDAWFVGFTPQLTTAVWIGATDAKVPMHNVGGIKVFGGTYPARIWHDFMQAALDGQPSVPFTAPDHTRGGKYLHMKNEPDQPDAAVVGPVPGDGGGGGAGGGGGGPGSTFDATTTTRKHHGTTTTSEVTIPPGDG
jgi:penicillin-binding protein 1A